MPTSATHPLDDLHRRMDAAWIRLDGARVVDHYGEPSRERALLEEGCGLFDASGAPLLEMRGEDRHRFLNGLITAEVKELAAGSSRYGLFPTVKGRILADVTVLAHDESFWLRLPRGTGEAIATHIDKHVITDRVEIAALEDYCRLVVLGAAAAACLDEIDGMETPAEGTHRLGRIADTEVIVASERHAPLPAYSVWVPSGGAESVVESLIGSGEIELVGFGALERLRIEHGVPRFGADFGAETFPQEAGLDWAVSYEKGCYLGQEVIARIHYRGGVQRRLVLLESAAEDLPEVGAAVAIETEAGWEEIGHVTSRAPRFGVPGWGALAMVKMRAAEPGTRLVLTSGDDGVVVEAADEGRAVAW